MNDADIPPPISPTRTSTPSPAMTTGTSSCTTAFMSTPWCCDDLTAVIVSRGRSRIVPQPPAAVPHRAASSG
jgi:hypothetical protein